MSGMNTYIKNYRIKMTKIRGSTICPRNYACLDDKQHPPSRDKQHPPSRTLRSASDTLSLQIPRCRLSIVGSRFVFGPSTSNDPLPSEKQKKKKKNNLSELIQI